MITGIEDYFRDGCGRCERFATADCSSRKWNRGLAKLRRICLAVGLQETVKWGHPCYTHHGRNVAILGALREDFRLSFFHAALLRDSEGILERQGPNTRAPDMIRFTHDDQVDAREHVIRSYLREAMSYAEAGIRPPRSTEALELPPELEEALDCDPVLAEAFFALTPGRQRSYVIALQSARKPQTRVDRIAKFRDGILAGKGAMER